MIEFGGNDFLKKYSMTGMKIPRTCGLLVHFLINFSWVPNMNILKNQKKKKNKNKLHICSYQPDEHSLIPFIRELSNESFKVK